MNRDKSSSKSAPAAGDNLVGPEKAAEDRNEALRELGEGDDRGGSRDGERLDAGDPGDRSQLDRDS